jgi:hypothetical protein
MVSYPFPLKGVLLLYNKNDRCMRLLHIPTTLGFLPFAVALPETIVATVFATTGTLIITTIAIWGTLPDLRSAWLEMKQWCRNAFRTDWYWNGCRKWNLGRSS